MIGVRVRLTFPEELVREPIMARMIRELGVVPNIRRATSTRAVDGSSASWTEKEAPSSTRSNGSGRSVCRWTCSVTSSRAETGRDGLRVDRRAMGGLRRLIAGRR
jgi:NIL domain